jgi:hypothetical protein
VNTVARTGEELQARRALQVQVRWGAAVRLVLTVVVERSVPHLIAIVEMGAHAAPPPFGGGDFVRADSGAVQREYVSVPCVETTGIPGMRAARLPENDGWEMCVS